MDTDELVATLVMRARRELNNTLPEGFTITSFKNGSHLGKCEYATYRAANRQWVEDMLFLAAWDEMHRHAGA